MAISTTKKMKKIKTPKDSLTDLCKRLDDVEAVFLIERLHKVKDLTLDSIDNNPEYWQSSFVHPSVYQRLFKKVEEHLKPY